jgi:hypothetical protein
MSNQPFGSPASASTAYAPTLGLRQRHSSVNAASFGVAPGDENFNPNGNGRTFQSHTTRKIPAPPRASLASTAGKFNTRWIATADRMRSDEKGGSSDVDANTRALVPAKNGDENVDLSLWVVGFGESKIDSPPLVCPGFASIEPVLSIRLAGYRNEAQFRALYQQLSSCGVITARRGGLSCFGEKRNDNAVDGDNWVAVRYESVLCAHKALCQHANLVSVGGSMVILGVMPLNDPGVAAKLGIDVGVSTPWEGGMALSAAGSCNVSRQHKLRTEADIMRDDGVMDNESKSELDSLCGKFLAWFFMWD